MSQSKPEVPRLAVMGSEAAQLLGISDVHFRKLKRTHLMGPRPVHFGLGPEATSERGERWNVAELTAWLNAGCPTRDRWEALKMTRFPEFLRYEPPATVNRTEVQDTSRL